MQVKISGIILMDRHGDILGRGEVHTGFGGKNPHPIYVIQMIISGKILMD
jgi:hypothetical protein